MTTDRFHARPQLGRWAALLVAAASVAVTGVAVSGTAAFPANGQRDQLHRFEHQAIAWHDCRTNPNDREGAFLAADNAVCGELAVPLDYRHPDGRTISVAVARRPATDTAHRLGTLFLNSANASRATVELIAELSTAVAARYDVVSFDARFQGLSTPVSCGRSVGLRAQLLTATPDRASFAAHAAVDQQSASLCAKHADLLRFASSRNIARDTDILRSALGEHRISYLGTTRGGYQAAVYLQMFGQHVDRMVLDSAPDPNAYGWSLNRDNASAESAALAHWAAWAAQRDARYHLGTSTASVLHTVQAIVDATRRGPLRVGDFMVTAAVLPSLVDPSKDDSDATYAGLSVAVGVFRDAAKGLAVTPSPGLASALRAYSDPTVLADDDGSAGQATTCGDRPAPRDPEFYWRDIQDHLATEPFYGPFFRTIGPCAFWPTNPIEPPTTIDNHHPVLMVGGTGDSHISFASQLGMHQALHGSRMVALDGSFRHIQYLMAGNACIDNTVQNYLLGAPLPPHDVTCSR